MRTVLGVLCLALPCAGILAGLTFAAGWRVMLFAIVTTAFILGSFYAGFYLLGIQ